jgi:hypothetical protein
MSVTANQTFGTTIYSGAASQSQCVVSIANSDRNGGRCHLPTDGQRVRLQRRGVVPSAPHFGGDYRFVAPKGQTLGRSDPVLPNLHCGVLLSVEPEGHA